MRLTNDMRDNILRKATAAVPTLDYLGKLIPVIQKVLYDHMPPAAQAAFDDPESRKYMVTGYARVFLDNRYNSTSVTVHPKGGRAHEFYGVVARGEIDITTNPDAVKNYKRGTLKHDLSHAVIKSGFHGKHLEQEQLLDSIKKRLKATLDSVASTKRLYDVLEPELHHLIPKETDKTANLPATAGPVVADLIKLGAVLPTVPKATAKAQN